MRYLTLVILFSVLGCTYGTHSTVTSLDLSNQKLSAIPDSVFSLSNLEHLKLGNNFTIYPPLSEIGDYPESIPGIGMNKITVIPNAIGQLHSLRTLALSFIDLRSLPTELLQLKQLDTLDISFNEHLNIASELGILSKMTWLKYLNIIQINIDQTTIEALRKSLPNTRIVAKVEDLPLEEEK